LTGEPMVFGRRLPSKSEKLKPIGDAGDNGQINIKT